MALPQGLTPARRQPWRPNHQAVLATGPAGWQPWRPGPGDHARYRQSRLPRQLQLCSGNSSRSCSGGLPGAGVKQDASWPGQLSSTPLATPCAGAWHGAVCRGNGQRG